MELTAIQELFEFIDYEFGFKWDDDTKQRFKELLEKEKEQLKTTYWNAYQEGQISSDVTAEEYYNEKYNNDTTRTNSIIPKTEL